MYATRTCPTKFFDFDQNPSVVLSSDQFQSVEHFDNSVCRIHFKTNLGILVVIRNFFLFSHRRPKNSKGITVQESNGQLFLSQRRPLEQQYFFSDIDVEIPKNLNFRSTVVITDARLNCSKEGAAWKSCGRDVCIPVAAFCDGIENCADGFDERNCEEINLGNDAHNCLSPFSVIFRPFSSSLYMLIGFFLLNAFFVAFFIVLAICSLGFCYSRKFYQGQLRRSRRTFIRYLRSAHKQVEDRAQLPETILTVPPEEDVEVGSSSPSVRKSSIISRLNFLPEETLEEIEPEAEDREQQEFQFEKTFTMFPSVPTRKFSAPDYFQRRKKNSLVNLKPTLSAKVTRN